MTTTLHYFQGTYQIPNLENGIYLIFSYYFVNVIVTLESQSFSYYVSEIRLRIEIKVQAIEQG